MSGKTCILPSHFLADVVTYAYYLDHQVKWESFENYQKRSIRNRTQLILNGKTQSVSIPLRKGKNSQMPIKEVEISYDTDWVKDIKHNLTTVYGMSPYLMYYKDSLWKVFDERPLSLWELNKALHLILLEYLNIECKFEITDEWRTNYPSEIVDKRSNVDSKLAYSYPQQHKQTFVSGLSIIDLLFNCGPESPKYLRKIADRL